MYGKLNIRRVPRFGPESNFRLVGNVTCRTAVAPGGRNQNGSEQDEPATASLRPPSAARPWDSGLFYPNVLVLLGAIKLGVVMHLSVFSLSPRRCIYIESSDGDQGHGIGSAVKDYCVDVLKLLTDL